MSMADFISNVNQQANPLWDQALQLSAPYVMPGLMVVVGGAIWYLGSSCASTRASSAPAPNMQIRDHIYPFRDRKYIVSMSVSPATPRYVHIPIGDPEMDIISVRDFIWSQKDIDYLEEKGLCNPFRFKFVTRTATRISLSSDAPVLFTVPINSVNDLFPRRDDAPAPEARQVIDLTDA